MLQQRPRAPTQPEVRNALRACRVPFISAGVFSCFVNILMLTGPLFMLQVYDRVLTSSSVPTLVALIAIVVALYGYYGFLEFIRARILVAHRPPGRRDACATGCSMPSPLMRCAAPRASARSRSATSRRSEPSSRGRGRSPSSTCRGCRSISPSSS